jgi:dihydroorotate dehydrogenase (NAD+) catalytic subunit
VPDSITQVRCRSEFRVRGVWAPTRKLPLGIHSKAGFEWNRRPFLTENTKTPVIVSLFATKVTDFVKLVEKIAPLKPAFIELNLSCPNVEDELGKPLALEKGSSAKIIKEVKKYSGKIPVLAKLSPNVSNIGEIAKGCEDAGADGITAINTVGPGMIIDINKRKPVLGAKKGGVSGPAILPITVRCVYEIYEAVKIPIIGVGGVAKWQDVIELMLAGASLIGVGTSTYTKGMKIFDDLKKGLNDYLDSNKCASVKEIVGLAHQN